VNQRDFVLWVPKQVVLYNIKLVESGLKMEQPKNLFFYEQFFFLLLL